MKTLKYLVPIAAAAVIFSSCNRQPQADFTMSSSEVYEGEEVTFTNNTKRAKSYSWNFGDSNYSEEENPKHSYTRYGNYVVELTCYSNNEKKVDKHLVSLIVKSKLREQFIGKWNADYARQDVYNATTGELLESTSDTLFQSYLEFKSNSTLTGQVKGEFVNENWAIVDGNKMQIEGVKTEYELDYDKLNLKINRTFNNKRREDTYHLSR